MARLFGLSVILLCCLFEAICVETEDSEYRDAARFVLDTFNRRPGSSYVYDSEKELSTSRVKRQEQLPEGIFEVDANHPYIQEIANFALAYIEESNTYDNRLKIHNILEAKQQVDEGTKVFLTLELGYTDCLKGENDDLSYCQLKEEWGLKTCYVDVEDGQEQRTVTRLSCSSSYTYTSYSYSHTYSES